MAVADGAASVIGVIRGRYKGFTSDKDLASLASLCDLSKQIGSVTGSRVVSKGKGHLAERRAGAADA